MRRVTYVDESVIVGDEFGMLVLDYAASLIRHNLAEPLHFVALSDEGEVETAFLLGPASQLVVVKTESLIREPDNTRALAFMRSRIREMAGPASPHGDGGASSHSAG